VTELPFRAFVIMAIQSLGRPLSISRLLGYDIGVVESMSYQDLHGIKSVFSINTKALFGADEILESPWAPLLIIYFSLRHALQDIDDL
jgi:hypothetical protein